MRQLSTLLMSVAVLSLTACGDDTTEEGFDHLISTEDASLEFSQPDLTIAVGDVVRFQMSSTHNAIEVAQETYDNRETTALDGGFEVDFGETANLTFDEAGTFYYVCQPHVEMDMVGTITVE